MEKRRPCDLCGNEGVEVLISRRLAGSAETWSLCAACASSRGVRISDTVLPCLPADLLDPLLELPGDQPIDQGVCAACGITFGKIRSTGLAGCVHCYTEFHAQIARLLPRIARRTSHTGSIPRQLHEFRRLFADKADLNARLAAALQAEDFEAAAGLRDVLQDLGEGKAHK